MRLDRRRTVMSAERHVSREEARKIGKEIRDYYTRLDAMEAAAR